MLPDLRESVCYQHVSSVVSRLSGQTDPQPLVTAVCLTRLPARLHLCAQIKHVGKFIHFCHKCSFQT